MKNNLKGLKLTFTSPNESVSGEFHIDEISFEANLQEVSEQMRFAKEAISSISDTISDMMDKAHKNELELAKVSHENEVELIRIKAQEEAKLYMQRHGMDTEIDREANL
jgi:hypothetical protein